MLLEPIGIHERFGVRVLRRRGCHGWSIERGASPYKTYSIASESAELPEPAQGQPHFGSLEPVTTHESFNPDPLESSTLERGLHRTFRRGRGDLVLHPTADPNRNVQEIRSGLVGLVGGTQTVVVDSTKIKAANVNQPRLRHHRAQDAAPLRAARHPRKRDRPFRALGPVLAHRFQGRAQHAEAPRRGILPRLDGRVRSENHPALGIGWRSIPFRIHRTGPMVIRRGRHDEDRPAPRGIEARRKGQNRSPCLDPWITSLRRDILKILRDWEANLHRVATLHLLSSERGGFQPGGRDKKSNQPRPNEEPFEFLHRSNQVNSESHPSHEPNASLSHSLS